MATRLRSRAKELHDEDFYAWAGSQAQLLREGRFDELDLENLIEEVEDLGGALKRSVQKRAITIMLHLLKLQHSPADDPRLGWRETVRTQRTRLRIDLTPNLRRVLADDLSDLYDRARNDAEASLRDYGEDAEADALPDACPFTLDQITGDWLP
jgi:hypothetical protein